MTNYLIRLQYYENLELYGSRLPHLIVGLVTEPQTSG